MLPHVQLGPFGWDTFALAQSYAVGAAAWLFWLRWRAAPLPAPGAVGRAAPRVWLAFAAALGAGWGASELWRVLRVDLLGPLVEHPEHLGWGSRWLFVGLAAALGGGSAAAWRLGLPVRRMGWALAPALAFAHVVQRLGCFLAGDGCYGLPTALPWGVAFPDGSLPVDAPVHPTMLYEAVWMALVGLITWRARPRGALWLFLFLTSSGCFVLQFAYWYPPVAGGLTEPQAQALVLAPASLGLWVRARYGAASPADERTPSPTV